MRSSQAWLLAGVLGLVAAVLAGVLLWTGKVGDAPEPLPVGRYVDAGAMLHLTETLSSDALEGRATGTPGNEAARGFLRKRFETLGLNRFGPSYEFPFDITVPDDAPADFPTSGTNLVGWIGGDTPGTGKMLVVSAHYDHLGVRDGEIYNGADDNASGSAALIEIASYFTRHKPHHDIVFALVDAEEIGLLGAKALVAAGPFDLSRVALDLNVDMVSRSDTNELHACGPSRYPGLTPLVEEVAADSGVTLLIGHDRPEQGPDDWTMQSDHGAFHEAGIPFLYLGVEDHADYHRPTDTFDKIQQAFFIHAADTAVAAAIAADAHLDTLDFTPATLPEANP